MKSKIFKTLVRTLMIGALCCSSRATIKTTQGTYEAKLIGADAKFVYLNPGDGVKSVNKASIIDISHPGKTLMFSGILLMTLGVGIAAESYSGSCGHPCFRSLSAALGIGVFGIPGLIFTFQGYQQYSDSRSALLTPMPQEPLGFRTRFEMSPFLSYSYRY